MDNFVADAISPVATRINYLDIGIGLLLLLSGIFAYTRGIVQETLSIAGWIGAIFITIYAFPYLKPYAQKIITIKIVADFATGIIIFITSLLLISLFTKRISKVVKNSELNAIDSSLGFLFGLARGALILIIAYIGLRTIYPEINQPEWIKNSRSIRLIKPGAEFLVALIPENLNVLTNKNVIDNGNSNFSGNDINSLMLPRPKNLDTRNKDTGGYSKKERQQMERLNDSIQKR